MNLRDQSVAISCAAIAEPTSTLTGGENQQGLPLTRMAFPDANVVYSRRFQLGDSGESVDLDLADGTFTEHFDLPEIEGVPEGAPHYLKISGTLTDGSDPIVFPLLAFTQLIAGSPAYEDEVNEYACAYNNSETRYELSHSPSTSIWRAANNTTSPHLVTSWAPVSPATGVPSVLSIYPSQSIDPSGKDIYGNDLPTMTKINAVLIECLAGGADIEVNGDELKSVSAGEKRLCANVNGLASYLDTMEIAATAANTEIRITVIGES